MKRNYLVFVMLFVFLLTACADLSSEQTDRSKTSTTNSNQVSVEFVRVVDGDTAVFLYNGVEEKVRYLLIDTPESVDPNECVQPYGKDASARNEALLKSGKVTLEFEKSERDKYGRLLGYVFVDGVSVQETLLEEGLARVAYIYEPPYQYLDDFYDAESVAQSAKIGIWENNGYVTDRGFNQCVDDSSSTITETKEDSTETNIFNNCTDLRKVYPDGVPSTHPAYQKKMDRDGDDYACEK